MDAVTSESCHPWVNMSSLGSSTGTEMEHPHLSQKVLPVCSGKGVFVAVDHTERRCMQFYMCMGVRLYDFGIAYEECFLDFFKLLTWRLLWCTADINPK